MKRLSQTCSPSINNPNVTAVYSSQLIQSPLQQDSAKTEVSSSTSLPSNNLLYETDSKFHKRLAAHRLLSPRQNTQILRTIPQKLISYVDRKDDRKYCPRFDWTVLQVVRTSFLSPRPRFYPPFPVYYIRQSRFDRFFFQC